MTELLENFEPAATNLGSLVAYDVGAKVTPHIPHSEATDSSMQWLERSSREEIVHELNSLRDLAEGWDGRSCAPINQLSISKAAEFVRQLPRLGTPEVVPMSEGRLQLEWHNGDRSLELEFESPTRLHYLKWQPSMGIEDEDVLLMKDWTAANSLVEWLLDT